MATATETVLDAADGEESTPPPPPSTHWTHWIECTDLPTGRVFYVNTHTNQTSWQVPQDWPELPVGWAALSDPHDGRMYYYNACTLESAWDRPGQNAVTSEVPQPPPEGVFKGHTESVTAVIQLHDGTLLSSSMDGTLRKWSQDDGKCLGVLLRDSTSDGHTEGVFCVLQLADGTVLSGAGDKSLCVWRELECVQTVWGHTGAVTCLAEIKDQPGVAGPFTTPGDLVASGSLDLSIRLRYAAALC